MHRPFPPERYLPYLTTNDVAALPKQQAAVIVVVAAIEQHGPHLPIATDLILGESLLTLALERTAARDAALGAALARLRRAATSTRRSRGR